MKMLDKELHEGLRKAGFNLTWELSPGSGEVGLTGFLFDRAASGTSAIGFAEIGDFFSEYFTVLDVGCGDLIVKGKVKVRGLWSLSEGLADSFDGVGQAGSRHQSLRQRGDSV